MVVFGAIVASALIGYAAYGLIALTVTFWADPR